MCNCKKTLEIQILTQENKMLSDNCMTLLKSFDKNREARNTIRESLAIQGYDGNWNYDPYMLGLYNGIELALATLEGRPPEYREAPEVWGCDIKEEDTPPVVMIIMGRNDPNARNL